MTGNSRYQGKPLLRLLELYVLWSIDQLSERDEQILRDMTPKLQKTYGVTGEWFEVIASAVKLPTNMPTLIRDMWKKNSEIAASHGTTLPPQAFAEMFVDTNLI